MIVTKNIVEIDFKDFLNEKASSDMIVNFLIDCYNSVTKYNDYSIHWAVFERIRDFIQLYKISRKGRQKIIEFSKLLQQISLLDEELVLDIILG